MHGVSVTLPYVVCLGSGEIHLALTMPGVQNDAEIVYLYIFGYLKAQCSTCEHPRIATIVKSAWPKLFSSLQKMSSTVVYIQNTVIISHEVKSR
jgi:hypothetical protein